MSRTRPCARAARKLSLAAAQAGELLPLVDMSLGLRPLMRVDENDSRDAGLRYLSLTGRLLALHRSLLFSRTKLAHWRAVIRATTTPTTPPQGECTPLAATLPGGARALTAPPRNADEYEKPRDIPTLHLNRVRAAAVGRNHDSGRHSLFAQLFRNIGSWADAQLRRYAAAPLARTWGKRALTVGASQGVHGCAGRGAGARVLCELGGRERGGPRRPVPHRRGDVRQYRRAGAHACVPAPAVCIRAT